MLACGRSKGLHIVENIVNQFEELVISFEITDKRLFSVVGWVFRPDSCRITIWKVCWLLTAQISEQTVNVIFLFFSSYSVIRNFIYCIRSHFNCLKNAYIKPCKCFFCLLKMSEDKRNRDCNRVYFQCNRNRLHLILFIRNCNRACGKQS